MLSDVAALIVHVGLRVSGIATAIAVEEHLHGLLDELLCLLLVERSLLGLFTQDRKCQVRSEAGGDHIVGVSASTEVDVTEERLFVLHAANDHVEPQRIEVGAAIVQDARQPSVQIFRLHCDLIVHREVGKDGLVDELLEILEVGVVSADSQDDVLVNFEDPVDVVVTSEISIRHEQVAGNNDALVIPHSNDRSSGGDGATKS